MKKLKCGADITFDELYELKKSLIMGINNNNVKEGDSLVVCSGGIHKLYIAENIFSFPEPVFFDSNEVCRQCPAAKRSCNHEKK